MAIHVFHSLHVGTGIVEIRPLMAVRIV